MNKIRFDGGHNWWFSIMPTKLHYFNKLLTFQNKEWLIANHNPLHQKVSKLIDQPAL
jgi:hypothetical protein